MEYLQLLIYALIYGPTAAKWEIYELFTLSKLKAETMGTEEFWKFQTLLVFPLYPNT